MDRHLTLLRAAGFGAIRVEAIPVVNASYSDNSFSAGMLQGFAKSAQKQNIVSAAQAEAWQADIKALAERDEYFFCVNRFLFSATK